MSRPERAPFPLPQKGTSQSQFSEECRRALSEARVAAGRFGQDFVGSEHLLLALTYDATSASCRLLEALAIDVEALRARVEQEIARMPARPPANPSRTPGLPNTARPKKTLELAMLEALNSGHSRVETKHLLIGLMAEHGSAPARLLGEWGVTLGDVRAASQQIYPEAPTEPFYIEIDNGSDLSIHEQIVCRVREGVATHRLRPSDRLPTVRQLAESLGVAPGTVSRAYAELERMGLIVTEGPRGTRVADRRAPGPATATTLKLVGLLRPIAVTAFHLGASGRELRDALTVAMRDIFD